MIVALPGFSLTFCFQILGKKILLARNIVSHSKIMAMSIYPSKTVYEIIVKSTYLGASVLPYILSVLGHIRMGIQ